MTTDAQQSANRRNATHSTGPRTEAGKRRVSRNAVTHGLDCTDLLLPEEDGAALAAYRAAMLADHDPLGAEEQDLVERMVAAQWRLHRLWRAEKEVYANMRHRISPNAWAGSCVIRDLQEERAFAYLDRKEASLSREYHRCSLRLEALQAQRRQGLRPEVVEEPAVAAEVEASLGPVGRDSAGGLPEAPDHRALASTAEKSVPVQPPKADAEVTTTPSIQTPIGEITEQSQNNAQTPMREAA